MDHGQLINLAKWCEELAKCSRCTLCRLPLTADLIVPHWGVAIMFCNRCGRIYVSDGASVLEPSHGILLTLMADPCYGPVVRMIQRQIRLAEDMVLAAAAGRFQLGEGAL